MKKLELKEIAEPVEKTLSECLMASTRESLKGMIAGYVRRIYLGYTNEEPDWESGEEYAVCVNEKGDGPKFVVKVTGVDENEFSFEELTVDEVRVQCDRSVYVCDDNGEEWYADDLKVDELSGIALTLERIIENIRKNNIEK